ncbi:DNA-binding transcriptional regulator [bacterium]|nr:DNA-binding transcriptional regulator [bacterium]
MDDVLDVIQAIAPSKALLKAFLRDLLTSAEYRDTALRWRIVKMLSQGVPQRDISAALGVSLSKITRGSRELSDDKGGFAKVFRQQSSKA